MVVVVGVGMGVGMTILVDERFSKWTLKRMGEGCANAQRPIRRSGCCGTILHPLIMVMVMVTVMVAWSETRC